MKKATATSSEPAMTGDRSVIEGFRDVMNCTCLRMRRATRRLTQIYDSALEPAQLTVSQFGLLANLYQPHSGEPSGLSIGVTAQRLGMDPTTLMRTLKPLIARGLIKNVPDPADARVRIVRLTAKGERALRKALPLWRQAQQHVEAALGLEATRALNGLLDLSASQPVAQK
jgi:DNA-binding MarR family transcriptional regulator